MPSIYRYFPDKTGLIFEVCDRGGSVIHVLIAEDQYLIRGTLVALLSRETDMELVAALVPAGGDHQALTIG